MAAGGVSFGPSFGLGILIPVSVALAIPFVIALRRAGSLSGAFVIASLWLRSLAGAYHVYMFKPFAAGLSGNALLSIAVTMFGLAFVVKPANLALKYLLPIYFLVFLALFSAAVNGDPAGGINVAVKYSYLVVMIIAVFQALRCDPEGRFIAWAMVAFLPLLVFQTLSIILGLPKGSEMGDGLVWIGGYNHEGAFSVALVTGFTVACFAPASTLVRVSFLILTLIGIQLAGYRTSILALAPLALVTFYLGATNSVTRDQRALMATAGVILGMIAVATAAIFYADKFGDLAAFLADPGSLIKPPREFDYLERQIMSARPLIWSSYIYAWAEGGALQHLFGFGPESWQGLFKVYPHNTLVATLYELGLFGVGAMILVWIVMTYAAWQARGQRLQLLAAHFAFFLLNMATMPFWQVEGLALYGFLCGYTIFRARQQLGSTAGNAPAAGEQVIRMPVRHPFAYREELR